MSERGKLRVPEKGYRLFSSKYGKIFVEGIWHNNPIFGMMLGLCSTLAVTNLVSKALVMSISVTIVLVFNSLFISLLRKIIPERVRMIAYMLIVSTLVIAVDMVLKIYLPAISKDLGPYVALIITNCIIMGRAEAYAVNNPPGISIIDALGVGVGYTFSLFSIAFFREILGFGTVLGITLIPEKFVPASLFKIAPGAFFALGFFILLINTIKNRKAKK